MLFRAYYATAYGKPMTTRQGIPTNAVFGFANMIQKAIDTVEPDSVLVAFDAGKHTFRHELYADYKGGRKPAPEDLVPQFSMVRDYLDAYGIRWVEMEDIEADDLIGSISLQSPDYETVILTSDRDLLQLIDDTTRVLLMKKGLTEMTVMTPDALRESMGIEPAQIIDLKSLMGDASDNIPGIKGIGEKTALKLLSEYGTAENVLAHEDELKGALGKKVKEGHDSALLSKRLATIKRDVELGFTADDCAFAPDYGSLVTFLRSLDMNMLASRYEEKISGTAPDEAPEEAAGKSETVRNVPASFFAKEAVSVFPDETRGHFLDAQIIGFGLFNGKDSCYITREDAENDSVFLMNMKEPSGKLIGFDIKRNMHLLARTAIDASFSDDAMILASLQDSTLTSPEKIAASFGLQTSLKYEDVYGKPNKPKLPMPEEQCIYACESARNIYRLYFEAQARAEEYGMMSLYRDIEMPLTGILCRMEDCGIACDAGVLDAIAEETKAEMDAEQEKIYELAGRSFNINSPKQLSEVLYDELLLPGGKKRSTAADVLEKMVKYHPVVSHILNYRKVSKLYSTYAEGLKKYIRRDGRIHTVYNQCATQTGRLSSSEPNLQNISVRDEAGRQIRRAFPADPDCVLISSDYHQIELRMLAHMADEQRLIEAFNAGIDIHTKTAMDIFDTDEEHVTSLMRRQAKTVNFGIVYGISDFGLSEQLGVSVRDARDFIDKYYETYPRIRSYMQELVAFCEKHGYVETLCGRRREIPEIRDKNRMVREFGKRAAMNAPVQGSAADLIKIAMIHIDRAMREAGVKSRMILQVHDELIFNVPEDEIDRMKVLITEGMEHAMTLKVPLSAECSMGWTWYEAK